MRKYRRGGGLAVTGQDAPDDHAVLFVAVGDVARDQGNAVQ